MIETAVAKVAAMTDLDDLTTEMAETIVLLDETMVHHAEIALTEMTVLLAETDLPTGTTDHHAVTDRTETTVLLAEIAHDLLIEVTDHLQVEIVLDHPTVLAAGPIALMAAADVHHAEMTVPHAAVAAAEADLLDA
ncbi:MAG TPA: hypothetical protein VK171_00680, partial [Fimbriimonas sp.]|nr:hypothetical protein [Fimbriimonas sp.]